MKKVLVSVLKYSDGRCANGGVTENHDCLHLFVDCAPEEALDYCEKHNINAGECLIYEDRYLWGKHHPICVPLVRPDNMVGPMFGGNYVMASGSNPYFPKYNGLSYTCVPLPVHDRFETPEMYDFLSR